MKQGMKESYRKGIANHPDPESCIGHRERAGEELTGAQAGRKSSCEIPHHPGCRRCSLVRKATTGRTIVRVRREPCAVLDPRHAWKLHAREPGGPSSIRRQGKEAGRGRKAINHTLHMHAAGGVGQTSSTNELSEQRELRRRPPEASAEDMEGRRLTK